MHPVDAHNALSKRLVNEITFANGRLCSSKVRSSFLHLDYSTIILKVINHADDMLRRWNLSTHARAQIWIDFDIFHCRICFNLSQLAEYVRYTRKVHANLRKVRVRVQVRMHMHKHVYVHVMREKYTLEVCAMCIFEV